MSVELALFARPLVLGRTKTRLATDLGAARALALYAAFLDDTVARALTLRAQRPEVAVVIACADAEPGDALRERADRWGLSLHVQVGDTLGERMTHALAGGIARRGAALVLGTDAPTLPLSTLRAACRALGTPGSATPELCFGPVADGGYILVGARGAPPSFDDVRMGTRHALADTLRANQGRALVRLPPWYDVDRPADLRLLRLHLALDPRAAPHTAAQLLGRTPPELARGVARAATW